MSFFDLVVDSTWLRQPDRPAILPEWCAPPADVVPATVDVVTWMVRTNDVAVWLGSITVFPRGIELTMQVRWRPDSRLAPPFVPNAAGRHGFCVGVETSDGHRILATRSMPSDYLETRAAPTLTVLDVYRGQGQASLNLWLWASPCTQTTWHLEWRARSLPEVQANLDLCRFMDLAERCERVWSQQATARPRSHPNRLATRLPN
jgi:hypothetical protein